VASQADGEQGQPARPAAADGAARGEELPLQAVLREPKGVGLVAFSLLWAGGKVAGQVRRPRRQLSGGGMLRGTAPAAALFPPKNRTSIAQPPHWFSPPCCSPALQAAQGAASSVGQWWESRGADQLKQSGEDSLAALKVGGHLHRAGILRRPQHLILGCGNFVCSVQVCIVLDPALVRLFPLQEWQETLGQGLAGAGSELERQMAALQQNLGEAVGEVGSGITGERRRLSLLIIQQCTGVQCNARQEWPERSSA
jgi:hypothetical protein